ncbi:hypothetical protein CC80DRAFT_439123 [Byssothecium circinans]|uniref:Uncharacterized protein n=1 Tax=Byssothecium circinans TaxID=147558 RepID=A0A6A5U6T0_9PLEO|nr:hypothetical protein CC80DRAFT_439123 [Byssothecium circinans]
MPAAMADSHSTLSTTTSGNTHTNTNTNTNSLFSRRPSFFGGRSSKPPKTPTTQTPPAPAPAAAGPPVINFPDLFAPPAKPSSAANPPRQHRRHASRHSVSSTLGDFGSQLQRSRSASVRTNDSSGTTSTHTASSSSHQRAPSNNLALSYSPEKNATQAAPSVAASNPSRPALSISTFARSKQQKAADNVRPDMTGQRQGYDKPPLSAAVDSSHPKTPLRSSSTTRDLQSARRPDMYSGGLGPAAPIALPSHSASNPNMIFQHIQEMASKRISTLDYLRKSHEGRIYWFNTLLFSKPDLTRLPSFTPRNLARRATHYLLLGFSLPTILDLNSSSPTDYLRALNALLLEFEQYQTIHPADGSAPSTRTGRIPGMQMFKRANIGGKGRRSSSATTNDLQILTSQNSFGDNTPLDSPPENDLLLPNESYSYLQTPSLPFDPDFFSTFATLCDVLIDCYTKILSLLSSPESIILAGNGVPLSVAELFNKADARVRKIILAGVVREFEESCRQGVRAEVGGVGKVVLGGLM